MELKVGKTLLGPYGSAAEVLYGEQPPRPDWKATVAMWFLTCPGQSPLWEHYMMYMIHLRPIWGVAPAIVRVPRATHEVMLLALDPERHPSPTNNETWAWLRPINVQEQIQLPDDDAARALAEQAAEAIVNGILPAEPPLAGAREPWRTVMIRTSAHMRGEEHAS